MTTELNDALVRHYIGDVSNKRQIKLDDVLLTPDDLRRDQIL